MTIEELRRIRNPDLTVEEILRALSKDERDAIFRRLMRDAYQATSMTRLWDYLDIAEKKDAIKVITYWMLTTCEKRRKKNAI